MLIRHRALCSLAIEYYAHSPSSIMLIRHRVLCSFAIEYYATRTEGLQALLLSVSLVGRPCLIDAVPEVVDALTPDDLDEEGKEGADEHLLDDQLLGDTRLVNNRVGGKRSSFSPTFVFRPLTPPYMRFRIRRFLFWVPFEV